MRNNYYPNTTQTQTPQTGYYRGVRPQLNPDDTFPLTEDDNIDYLTTKYPALADRIQLLRNRGVQDEQIQNVIETQALPRLNYFANGEQIRKMLGQTDQSMEKVARYENLMRYKLFRQAFPDKSDNDIQEAIQIQQMTGVPANAYLNDPKLFKSFKDKIMRDTGRIKERETYLDAAARGVSNFWTQFQISDIRRHQRAGDISDEEADRAVEQLRAKFIPEPLFHSFGTDAINGAFSIATQKYNTLFQSMMTGGYWGALGGTVGLVGGGLSGAWEDAKLGYWLGSMYEGANQIFTLSAGADYENMINLKDENGQPIDKRAAWLASGITGLLNVATEYGLWSKTAKLFPGVESVFSRADFIKAVQHNPVLREGLSQLAKDTTEGIIASTANNTIESVISDYAVPLAQFIAEVDYQQPFPQANFDWDKLIQNAKDTAGRSLRDFSAAALPSVFLGLAKISKQHFDYSKAIKETASRLNVPEAQVEESFYQARLQTQEIMNQAQDNSQGNNEQQTTTTPETQEQPTASQTTPEIQQEKKSDYVFMPLAQLQEAGYEPVFTVDKEGAVTWEQYEQIKADNPEFIQSVQHDLRFGAKGVSVSDMEKKIEQTDQAKADFFHSPENQARIDEAAQDFINAGADEQEAHDLGMLIGAVNASSLARTGEQLPPITVREVQELEQQLDYSRLSPEYDINNPDTWPDKERAEKFKELTNWDKLPDSEKNVKALLDLIRGKIPDKADELSEKSGEVFEGLKDEAPDKVRSTRNALFRDEFEAYSQTLRENAKEVGEALSSRSDLDPARYEINSDFPKGKRRNPDESYYFENWDGNTKIDFATDGADLKIRIKHTGDKSPLTIAVKHYRNANLFDVVHDLTSGFTAKGFQISESPTAMFLARALNSLWDKLGLSKVQVNALDAHNELMNPPAHFSGNDFLDEDYHSPDTQENRAILDDTPEQHIPDIRPAPPEVDYNPDFDEDTYSPDFQHNYAVLEDIPEQHTPDTIPIPDTDRNLMPEQARFKLASDEATWRKTVDTVLTDPNVKTTGRKQIPVMRTPLVMTLVGAKHFPVSINDGKLKLILRDHENMTPDILKNVPRAITDPIAIFESKSEGVHPAKVVLTELKDANGADIITAFHLDYKGDINKLASSYAKEKGKGGANPEWFREQAEQGRMLYINTDKAKAWAQSSGVDLTQYSDGAKTQQDLQQLWDLHKDKGYYYTDPETGEIKGWMEQKYGRAIINLIKSGNFATKLHETAHVYFNFMTDLAKKGHVQMNEDFETILRHADVTREAWDNDTRRAKGGAREQAHEWFAKAFEVYVSEGKAPSEGLNGVFERAKKRLLEIYDDITNQLGIKNYDDEVRAVFNRLLTLPGDENETVSDIVTHEIQTENQIKLSNERIRELEEQIRLQEETKQDYEQGAFELNPDAVAQVENYGYELDYRELQQDELKAQQDYINAIYQVIRQNGGLQAQDVIYLMGKGKAAELSKKWRGIWNSKKSGSGLPVDLMAHELIAAGFPQFSDSNTLLQWLDDYDYSTLKQKIQDVPARLPINTDTLNALLAVRGTEDTIDYLNKRLKLIHPERADEVTELKDWLSRLDPSLDEGIKTPRAKKKRITKRDVRQTANTGFKMEQEQERIIQKAKQDIQKLTWEQRAEQKAEKHRQAREADKAKYQERIQTIQQRLTDKFNAKAEKLNDRLQREIAKHKQARDELRSFKLQASENKNINRMVKAIFRMSNSASIRVEQLEQIRQLLDNYNLDRKGISRRDIIRSFLSEGEQFTSDFLDENGLTQQDVDEYLNKIHIEDMTLGELRELHNKVSSIFQQSRREYQIWEQQRKERRLELQAGMEQNLLDNTKAPEKRVITEREDLHKQRNPLANLLHNYWIGTQQAGTYLAGLGENFRRVIGDGFTQRRGEAFRFIHQRETDMLLRLKELGLTPYSFAENAITLDGKTYSWAEVIGIANAMRNPKSAMSVLWGNFVNNLVDSNKPYNTEQEGLNAINKILDLINAPENEKYKKAAELILQDFDTHYERIEAARRRDFNRSMNNEENYSPMYRLRRNSAQGLVDTQLEALGDNGQYSQILHKVADNFTISRKNINPMAQAPISLNAWANWLNAMTDQEFAAALGGYAADVTSALLLRGEHGTIKNMVQERLGDQDWETLRSIFNDSINDSMMQEQLAADEIASALVRNRSIVYVAGRIPTALAQFASYFSAIPYSSTKHLFRSLANSLRYRSQFLENVYNKAPELRYTGGDPIDKAINRNSWLNQHQIKNDRVRRGINSYKRGIDNLYKGVQLIDNWTKSIVFDAVYNSELENGNSEEDAVRLAYRAVQGTQPASSPREMTRLNRNSKGVTRLAFTQFMGALAPLYNMSIVDVARNLAHPSWNSVKASAWNLLAVGISIAAAGVIKDFFSGKLPTYNENPDGSIDDVSSWFIDTEINGLISNIPVFNRIWDGVKSVINHKHYTPDDRFTEPFTSIAKGLDYYFNDKYEGEYNDKAVEQIAKGLGLMGIPIPFAGIRDFFRFFGSQEED